MKLKYLLTVCLYLVFTPSAMADNAEDLYNQGVLLLNKGDYSQATQLFIVT